MSDISSIRKAVDAKMQHCMEALKHSLSKIRTGRANPALLDGIHVDYYGTPTPISQVANVSLLDARTIGIEPWEKPMGPKIEKAIRDSNLGLNPLSQGTVIRVPVPPMSEERRKELVKLVKGEAEHAKVSVRGVRKDANDQVKKRVKDKLASEDDQKRAEAEVQKITDTYIQEVDKLIAAKEQEVMSV